MFAVHHDNEAGLLSLEKALDNDAGAGITEFVVGQHVMNGGLRLSQCHGNDDAFARRQTIGFDDDRCALLMNVVERRFDLVKTA